MPVLKVASFNVEWMWSLFGATAQAAWDGTIPATFPGKSMGPIRLAKIDDVHGLCRRIAAVIRDVGADITGILEGPPLKRQMERFVTDFLNDDYVVFQSNSTSQSIHALVKRSIANRVTHVPHDNAALGLINGRFFYYPWLAFKAEDRKRHNFDRVPLVLKFSPAAGKELQVITVHTKSKISKLKTREQWENREEEAVISALDSRQKLSAEIARLRQYITQQLTGTDRNKGVVVMGDFNDGPFHDLLEEEFLVHNILDELVGSFLEPDFYLTHAFPVSKIKTLTSVEFPDPLNDGQLTKELIDHILVSPSLRSTTGAFKVKSATAKVEDAAYEAHDDDVNHDDRGLRPSDHRPLSVEIKY